jgi:hypothetical protein
MEVFVSRPSLVLIPLAVGAFVVAYDLLDTRTFFGVVAMHMSRAAWEAIWDEWL